MRAPSSRPFCSCERQPGEPAVFIRSGQVHDPAGGLSRVKAKPSAVRSGWLASSPALTLAPPQWRRCERREERKNCRGPAAQAAERSRSATLHSRSQGRKPRETSMCLRSHIRRQDKARQELSSIQKTKAAREV